MENEYFKPNPALRVASVDKEQIVGQQQIGLDMAAADAMMQITALQEADRLAQQGLTPVVGNQAGLGSI